MSLILAVCPCPVFPLPAFRWRIDLFSWNFVCFPLRIFDVFPQKFWTFSPQNFDSSLVIFYLSSLRILDDFPLRILTISPPEFLTFSPQNFELSPQNFLTFPSPLLRIFQSEFWMIFPQHFLVFSPQNFCPFPLRILNFPLRIF